jgi:two-component sensor histidine kinase
MLPSAASPGRHSQPLAFVSCWQGARPGDGAYLQTEHPLNRPEHSQPGLAWVPDRAGMARRVREFDWASTPLGPIAQWPVELRTAAGLVLESGFPKALMWGPSLTTIYNDAFRPILGSKPEALGRSFRDIWAEAWDVLGPIADRAYGGVPTYIENFEVELDRFGRPAPGWFTFSYHPVRMADGSVGGVMDTVVETTAMVRAHREAELLRDELAHRLKNTLAMVQAIASRSFAGHPGMDAFQARLRALGEAYDVLLQQRWGAAPMRRMIDTLLSPYGDRIALDGPDVLLGPRTMVALSLVLHELATNAIKYGALSVPEGGVSLRWQQDAGGLVIRWREAGGPPVATPDRTGFGSRLIDMGWSGIGRVERRYPVSGVEVDLRLASADLAA